MECFDLEYVQSFGIPIKGIVAVGAHYGEEAEEYSTVADDVVWLEAHPEFARKMIENVEQYGQAGYEVCVSDVDGEVVDFWVTKDEYASSMMKPKLHQEIHPQAPIVGKIEVVTKRFDTFWEETFREYTINFYNMLVLDTEGSEAKVLRGMGKYLDYFDIVVTEYSTIDFYEGGAQLSELQELLSDFDMVYPDVVLTHANALFIRRQA